jgi:hypothetical protein
MIGHADIFRVSINCDSISKVEHFYGKEAVVAFIIDQLHRLPENSHL